MGDLSTADLQRSAGVTKGTQEKEDRVLQRWHAHLKSIELEHYPFLQGLDPAMRARIFGTFASALQ
jgi:hypothetical protein